MKSLIVLLLLTVAAASGLAADLAPTGVLRASFLGLNPVQGKVDLATGAITGPVADLVQELARRLNVPYKLLPEPDAAHVVADLQSGSADIAFLANDPARAAIVRFSDPYALMYNAYVVAAESPIQRTAEADRDGYRIAAVRGQTQQLFLSGALKHASVRIFENMPPQAELERLLSVHEIDAFGVNRQRAEEAAASSATLRALNDNFLAVEQSIIVVMDAKADAKILELNRFLGEVRASGFVKTSLQRAKLVGVAAAPDGTKH